MQSSNDSFNARNADSAKAPDYAFVIAGWPTIYTVGRSDYALEGELADFSAVRAWADIPSGSAAKVKGRPEEGKMTIGQMDIEVLDRVESGVRSLTSLLSRQAYLEGNAPGTTTYLTETIDNDDVEFDVADASSFSNGDVIHISLEAIKIGTISGNTLQGCTRGHLRTSATPHGTGVNVYDFFPNYYRRKAFIYKGYRQLPLDKWVRAFSGVVGGATKKGSKVSFSIMSTSWETWADGKAVALDFYRDIGTAAVELNDDVLPDDFSNIVVNLDAVGADLGGGNFMINIGNEIMWLTGAEEI